MIQQNKELVNRKQGTGRQIDGKVYSELPTRVIIPLSSLPKQEFQNATVKAFRRIDSSAWCESKGKQRKAKKAFAYFAFENPLGVSSKNPMLFLVFFYRSIDLSLFSFSLSLFFLYITFFLFLSLCLFSLSKNVSILLRKTYIFPRKTRVIPGLTPIIPELTCLIQELIGRITGLIDRITE